MLNEEMWNLMVEKHKLERCFRNSISRRFAIGEIYGIDTIFVTRWYLEISWESQ